MKKQWLTWVVVLGTITPLYSQMVASHAPTTVVKQSSVVAPQPAGKPVARVNGAVLTDRDLLREMYTIFPYARQHNGFPKEMEGQIRSGAMQMIIFEELAYQEAVKRNLTVSPARLQRAEKDFQAQFSTPEEFQKLLQSEF